MIANDVYKRLKAKSISGDSATIERDGTEIKVTISVSDLLCSIDVETNIKNNKKYDDLIEKINNQHAYTRYSREKDRLHAKTGLWVNTRPTKSVLTDLTNMLISDLVCTKMALEVQDGR